MKPPMRNRVLTRVMRRILVLATFMGFMACAPDEVCFTENGTQVKIDFKKVIYPNTDSSFAERDTLIVFQIAAVDTDSIFMEVDTISSVVLPVNTGADVTIFEFDTDLGVHTMELQYQRTQRLISVDCGPEQIIEDLEAGETTFDSLEIIQTTLLSDPTTNVEVFR
jgi:hypothetical protein